MHNIIVSTCIVDYFCEHVGVYFKVEVSFSLFICSYNVMCVKALNMCIGGQSKL